MTTPQPVTAYLGLGSNIGTDEEKAGMLRRAAALLEEESGGALRVTGASSIFQTPPWGVTDQPPFYNAVLRVEATLSPRELLRLAKETERRLGRVPTYRWGPRLIDIDLLLMDRLTLKEEDLELPHAELLNRDFVVVPLLELEPDLVLPDGRRLADAAVAPGSAIFRVGGFLA